MLSLNMFRFFFCKLHLTLNRASDFVTPRCAQRERNNGDSDSLEIDRRSRIALQRLPRPAAEGNHDQPGQASPFLRPRSAADLGGMEQGY
jgi:hypothetical protein